MEDDNELTFKIIIVGSSSVGKSSLLMRYIHNEFKPQHYPTIGLEFFSKRIEVDGVKIKLQVWDTAGQETFQSIVRNFYKNSDAAFIVYSVTDKKSFQAVDAWNTEARDNCPESAIYVLIGAQKDLESSREVSKEDGLATMQRLRFNMFFETSAKEDQNISLAFQETTKQLLIRRMLQQKEEEKHTETVKLDSYEDKSKNESNCC